MGAGAGWDRVARPLAIAAAAAGAILGAAGAEAARADTPSGVDITCELGLSKFDPDTVNVAFPDDSAEYFSGAYQAAPGTRIRIDGQYPHVRYTSYNVYDVLQRPLDALADIELAPDPGSLNPFAIGADRTSPNRHYTAYINFGPIPSQRAANTLYTGTGQNGLPNYAGTFIYRIYIPDKGRDQFGDVGAPTLTLQAADGGPAPPSACANFGRPGITGVNQGVASLNGFGSQGQTVFDRNPPVWRKFTNLFQAVADSLTDSNITDPLFELQRQLDLADRGGSGGFLSNIHNAYLSANLSKAYGDVVVTRFRAPTFPNTRPGTSPMPGGQLRYWSLCENDPATQRFIQCTNDDRAVLGDNRLATYVVSTPGNRPANATAACAINWLPFGPNGWGVLIYRHMLPDPGFAQSIQRAKFGQEGATMGDYFPVSRYVSTAADFERLGCSPPGGGGVVLPSPGRRGGGRGQPGSRAARRTACVSRRRFRIRLPRGARVLSATVHGRHLRLRRVRGRPRGTVDLRGLPHGRFTLRLVVRLGTGRRVVLRRTYHTCVPRRPSKRPRSGAKPPRRRPGRRR